MLDCLRPVVRQTNCHRPQRYKQQRQNRRHPRAGIRRAQHKRYDAAQRNHQPAHNRRAALFQVLLRAEFVLARFHLVTAQPFNQLRASRQRNRRGQHQRKQYICQHR